jgi:carbonic anhydrase
VANLAIRFERGKGTTRYRGHVTQMTRPTVAAALVVASALALAACGGAAATPSGPPAWNHDPADAGLGPEEWGEIDPSFEACLDGDAQSPIDIADAVTADLPPLVFDYPGAPLVVENTGHVIEVPMPEDAGHALSIGDEAYTLEQYHFHAPSEHTLDGVSFDIEAHFVHRNDDGELAVVGVLFDTDAPPAELLDPIMTNAPPDAGEEVEVSQAHSPMELLPIGGSGDEISSYATYPGSLTTPGCTEGVRWIVLTDTLGASEAAVEHLHELIADFPSYEGYENNNRPTQPLNDREIQTSD